MRTIALAMSVAGLCSMVCGAMWAAEETKTNERLNDAAALFKEIMSTPDKSIPQDLLNKSHCIVMVPGLKKGGFVIAAKYGRGFVTCRHASGQGWGAPGAVRIEGGSVGLQIGVSSTDLVLLVMNERGMKRLLTTQFTLGGDASVAAGGRGARPPPPPTPPRVWGAGLLGGVRRGGGAPRRAGAPPPPPQDQQK